MRYAKTSGLFPDMTPAVKYLLLTNAAVFLAGLLFRLDMAPLFGLVPALVWKGAFWQPATYLLLHGGIFHLIFNMLVLWMFGTALEKAWGWRRFLQYYLLCGIGAGLLNTLVTPSSPVPIVGSSGAIYGLLLAFGILFPNQLIYVWGIFPVRARYFVIAIGLIEFLTSVNSAQSGIAHIVHLGGMLFGLLYLKAADWRSTANGWRRKKKKERHLKVVWDRGQEKQNIQQEIDSLLDLAAQNGAGSLTAGEHERFRELSRKLEELENRE